MLQTQIYMNSLIELVQGGHLSERSKLAGKIAMIAIHGGAQLEPETDTIAKEMAEITSASYYIISSTGKSKDFKALHIPSHSGEFTRSKSFRKLLRHCSLAISIHGHRREKFGNSIFVGGLNLGLREKVAGDLNKTLKGSYEALYRDNTIAKGLSGTNRKNIVNLFHQKGVQIELPWRIRVEDRRARKILTNTIAAHIYK